MGGPAGFLRDKRVGKHQSLSPVQNQCALDDIFEFSYISGPVIIEQTVDGTGRQPRLPGKFHVAGFLLKKIIDQLCNILLSLPERRNQNRKNVEAEPQVPAKLIFMRHLFQVAVGGGNQPDVHRYHPGAAYPFNFLFLQHAEHADLRLRKKLSHFVQEDRPAVRPFEASPFPGIGAARAIAEVLPEMKGKLDGLAIRVPTPAVSMVDLVATLCRKTSRQEVNAALKTHAEGPLKGILLCSEEELVSSDFRGNPHSSIVDLPNTTVIGGNMVKILSWYDNEWGFARRMSELIGFVLK